MAYKWPGKKGCQKLKMKNISRMLVVAASAVGSVLIMGILFVVLCCGKGKRKKEDDKQAETATYSIPLFSQQVNDDFPPPPPINPSMIPADLQFNSKDFPSVTGRTTSTYEYTED